MDLGWVLYPMIGVLIREKRDLTHRDTQRGRPCEDRQRVNLCGYHQRTARIVSSTKS